MVFKSYEARTATALSVEPYGRSCRRMERRKRGGQVEAYPSHSTKVNAISSVNSLNELR
jgi:hypothetical protein